MGKQMILASVYEKGNGDEWNLSVRIISYGEVGRDVEDLDVSRL